MNIKTLSTGIAGLVLATVLCLGCEKTVEETSDVLHEDAVVEETVYTPSLHSSSVSPGYNFGKKGGLTLQITNVDVPEKYAVVFRCAHGKFIIQGTDKSKKDLWSRMSRDMPVDVTYKEVYTTVYDTADKDKDGKDDLVSRTLKDYWFIDAVPKAEVSPSRN